VGEYYLISNEGDLTYVGAADETGERTTLTFTLPAGAENLVFDGAGLGERFLEREDGFADTEPIPPGVATVEVLFSYELPAEEGLLVERRFETPVSSVVLVISAEGLGLGGPGIVSAGAMETQMGPALSYTAGPLDAGELLGFMIVAAETPMAVSSPVPQTGTPAVTVPSRNATREVAAGLVVLVGALVMVYLLWQPSAMPMPSAARPLVEAIAALDADFEAERVDEKAYRRKRNALRRQLRTLVLGRADDTGS